METTRTESPCQKARREYQDGSDENARASEESGRREYDDPWFVDPPMAGTGTGRGTPGFSRRRRAREACWNDCEIRERCLNGALDREEQFGIWGGYSEAERREILRRMERNKFTRS